MSILIHAVWATKNRFPFLTSSELRAKVWEHIKKNATLKNIHVDTINGYSNHGHCLIALNSNQQLSEIMRLIKGESSNWINKNKLCCATFRWQEHYYWSIIPESELEAVKHYIRNQEEHHKKVNFVEEVRLLEVEFTKSMGLKPYKNRRQFP
jgi:REP element-mobilizing transposase RayT